MSYTAEIDDLPDDTPVAGCGCTGLNYCELADIDDCVLTPGDPSPAGRCPECGELVYPDRPEDRVRDAAPDMLAALEEILTWLPYSVPDPRVRPAIERASAAIAKAKGGAS